MGLSKITDRFSKAKMKDEGVLIIYLMGGDPSPEKTLDYLLAATEAGADILEVGLPFSDPIADGPVIQAASQRALAGGINPSQIIEIIANFRKHSNTPVVVMTYYNPVYQVGDVEFIKRAAAAGVDGLIVPDLPVEEAKSLLTAVHAHKIAQIFMVTPECNDQRIKKIIARSTGFVYLVARYGTTGARQGLSKETEVLIKRVSPLLSNGLNMAVGFGLSQPEHLRKVIQAGADGTIVGSRVVDQISKGITIEEFKTMIRQLKQATVDKS